jgi:hypothetical protein
LQVDHDHFCTDCQAYWGCEDPYCHLPTEERCPDDGGGWNTGATEHFHECRDCDERDGEDVPHQDWIHTQSDCHQPRRWKCEKHRAEPAVNGSATQLGGFCAGGCGRFVIRPAIICPECTARYMATGEREEALVRTTKRLTTAMRVAQCIAVLAGLVAFGSLEWMLEPVLSRIEKHPVSLVLLVSGVGVCLFCYHRAAATQRRIKRNCARTEKPESDEPIRTTDGRDCVERSGR